MSRSKRVDGPASRSILSSLLGQQGDPVGLRRQRQILVRDQALHHRAGYVGRKTGHRSFTQSLPTEQLFLWEALETLLEAFEVSGYIRSNPGGVLETTAQRRLLDHWTKLAAKIAPGKEGAFKLMKYKLAAFFSALMDVEMPIPPFPDADNPLQVVGGRRARRFVHAIKRAAGDPSDAAAFDSQLSLAVNVLQAKKGLPRPDQQMLEAAARKTFEELTTERKSPKPFFLVDGEPTNEWATVVEKEEAGASVLDVSWGLIQAETKRAVRDLFPEAAYSLADRFHPFFASTSANYISSRTGQGAVGALLRDHIELFDGLRRAEDPITFSSERREESARNEVSEDNLVADCRNLEQRFSQFYSRLLREAEDEIPAAQPVALAESLKTRVITKGPALLNTVLKPLQRYLWTTLSRHRVFQLIGRPVDSRVLLHALGAKLPEDQTFVSGDYSNATNELDSRFSTIVVDALSDRLALTALERELFHRSLTGHWLELDGNVAPQRNGQLMGSVTSFPVLCLANFVICRIALEHAAGHALSMSELHLLVNGDDCAFRTTTLGVRVWERCAAFVGLKPSIGKVYVSRRFVNINSTNFAFSPLHAVEESWKKGVFRTCPPVPEDGDEIVTRRNPFRLTRFVNFGLMYGLKRSVKMGLDDVCDPTDGIGARHRELLTTCPENVRDLVNAVFFRRHLPVLHRARVPWFLPEWLGGLGLVGDADRWSLLLSFWALTNWDSLKRRPAVGGDQPWKVRKLVQKRYLSTLPQTRLNDAQSDQEDRVLGLLCAATMFDSRVTLEDLYQPGGDGRAILQTNEKFWSWLRTQGNTRALPPLAHDIEGSRERAFQRSLETMKQPRVGVAFSGIRHWRGFAPGVTMSLDNFVAVERVHTLEWQIRRAERRLESLSREEALLVATELSSVGAEPAPVSQTSFPSGTHAATLAAALDLAQQPKAESKWREVTIVTRPDVKAKSLSLTPWDEDFAPVEQKVSVHSAVWVEPTQKFWDALYRVDKVGYFQHDRLVKEIAQLQTDVELHSLPARFSGGPSGSFAAGNRLRYLEAKRVSLVRHLQSKWPRL